jgi:hypothetical protein
MRVAALAMIVVLSCAALALAGFNVNVTKAPGFDPASVSKVVVVMTECHEALDCRRLEREVAAELTKAQLRLKVVVGDPVYSQLLGLGKERYSVDLREQLASAVGADTLLELSAPHASPGMATRKRSEVRLTLRLVLPTGEILFVGDGSGRPTNTLSSPEKAAGEVAERVFEEAFRP